MAIREYNQNDWYGLAGSQCWEQDGECEQPLICHDFEEFLITADPNGVFIYPSSVEGEEDSNGFFLDMDIPTQEIARCLLMGLTSVFQGLLNRQESPVKWALANGFEEC